MLALVDSIAVFLQILDDEEEALAAAETEAQVAGEEAVKAARRIEPKPDGRSKDRVSRLERKAREATNRAIALRLVIEGPPPTQVGLNPHLASRGSGILLLLKCTLYSSKACSITGRCCPGS